MSRLPSYRQLQAMSAYDAWQVLQIQADNLRTERDGLLGGNIRPWGKTTRRSALESNRRRLKRVYCAADDLGVHVGQPDTPEPHKPTPTLEWMTPLGKKLGDCTAHEIGFFAELLKAESNRKLLMESVCRELDELEAAAAAFPTVKPRIRVRAVTQRAA